MNTTCIDHGVKKESALLPAMLALFIAGIAGNFRPAIEAEAPEGYEDASGFHFGSLYVNGESSSFSHGQG